MYKVWTDDGVFLYDGKNQIGPYAEIGDCGPVGIAGKYWYAVRELEGWFIYAPDKHIGPYEKIVAVGYAPGSRDFAYAIREKGKYYYFRDGQKFGPLYSEVSDICLSADGTSFAYAFLTGKGWNISINGRGYGSYKGIISARFLNAGETMALAIKTARARIEGLFMEDDHIYGGGFFPDGKGYFMIKDNSLVLREITDLNGAFTQGSVPGGRKIPSHFTAK